MGLNSSATFIVRRERANATGLIAYPPHLASIVEPAITYEKRNDPKGPYAGKVRPK